LCISAEQIERGLAILDGALADLAAPAAVT
jgi:hypothetical protein